MGYFGNEFPSICNHSGVMATRSRKTLKKVRFFAFFLKKRPFTGKLSKFYSERIHRDTIDVLCSNFVKFGRREIGNIEGCLPDKKIRLAVQISTAWIALKICQGQPRIMYS